MEELSINLFLLSYLENLVLSFALFGSFSLSIKKNKKDYFLLTFLITVIMVIIRSFPVMPIIMVVTGLFSYALLFNYFFDIKLVKALSLISLIFIIYLFLETTTLSLLIFIFDIEFNIINENSLLRFKLFLPQGCLMLILGLLFRKNKFQDLISHFFDSDILKFINDIDFGRKSIINYLYWVTFFLIIQSLILITINWSNNFKQYFNPIVDSPFFQNSIIIIITSILLFLFYRLTKVFKSEHERIVEDIKEKNSQKMNDELRRQFHDLNQHFSTLNVMLQMDKVDEARDYLSNFIGELSTIRQNIETGNTALNALLYSKVAEARENQINIRVDVINKVDGIGVSNWELTRIIGNLLDNSREALMEKEGQKEIEIIFNQNEKIYKIEVKTKGIVISHQKEKNIFAEGYSSKERKGHGLGLYICRQLVEKYQGKIYIKKSCELTFTSFIVEIPKKN